jgi:hypothetical protein
MPIRANEEGSQVEWIVLWSVVLVVAMAATVSLAKLIVLDGYGSRSAPRRVDGWDASGLPSKPY